VVNLGVLLILSQFVIGILCGAFDKVREAMAEEAYYDLPSGFAPVDNSKFVHFSSFITSLGGVWHRDTLQMFAFYPQCFGVDCRIMRHTLIALFELHENKNMVTRAEFLDTLRATASAIKVLCSISPTEEAMQRCTDLMFNHHGAVIVDHEAARPKGHDEIEEADENKNATAAQVKQLSQRMTSMENTLKEVLAALGKGGGTE
jgi:hypothetical protein